MSKARGKGKKGGMVVLLKSKHKGCVFHCIVGFDVRHCFC